MLRLEDFMEIQKLHHDGLSVSEIARHLDMDRKTVRKYLKQVPREYRAEAEELEGRSIPWLSAGALGAGRAQRQPVVSGDPEARLRRLPDASEEGGPAVAERRPGAGVCAV